MFDEHCTLYVSSSTMYKCTAHALCSMYTQTLQQYVWTALCILYTLYTLVQWAGLTRVSVPLELCFTALTWQNTVHLSTLNPAHFILFSFLALSSNWIHNTRIHLNQTVLLVLHCYICNLYPICLYDVNTIWRLYICIVYQCADRL